MKNLIRIEVDKFNIKNSIDLNMLNLDNAKKNIISIESIFKEKVKIELNNQQFKLLLNGVMITNNSKDGVYRIYNNDKFVGLGIIKNKLLKRDLIIGGTKDGND
jgi:tRNA U55 pseudouridine synthase TruB